MSYIEVDQLAETLDLFIQPAVLVERGAVVHANPASVPLLGAPPEQVRRLPLRALLQSGTELDLQHASECIEVEIPWRGGLASGEVRKLNDDGLFLIVGRRDSRDSLAVRMADFADAAAEGVLIADAVGGINDPLASLMMSLEEAVDWVAHASSQERAELAPLLEEAQGAAQRVADVVRNVLSLPRTPARMAPLDVNELVERTVRTVCRQRHRVEVEAQLGFCAPITSARDRLEQVLMHVLLTAPAPEQGRPVLVQTGQSGRDVLVEVRGGGVPEGQLSAFRRRYAVVTSLVQQMGGACEARANEHGVHLRLRFGKNAPQEGELTAERGRRDSVPPRGELRILVVDDEPSIHRALQRALREVGFVQAVSSGNAAIDLLDGGARFDAVLCDVVMANGTGLDLADWLAEQDHPLRRRMLLMTGLGDSHNVSHPDTMTVTKPFDSATLRELVVQVASRA